MSIVVAGVLTYQAYTTHFLSSEPEDKKARYLPAGDIALERDGVEFSTNQLRGRPFILFFGFTSCPDVCPLGLTVIRDALNSDGEFGDIPAVFVSLDPERDTEQVLREYVAFFHPNIIPLRGELVQTHEIAKRYGSYFIKAPLGGASDDPEQYTVDHTSYYFVIDAEGTLRRVLEHNTKPAALADALRPYL